MDEQLQGSYKAIFGKSPSAGDMHAFHRVRDALKIKNDDALWSVLFALQYYLTLYERIPADIETRTRTIQEQLSETSRHIAEASMARAHEKLAEAVANASEKVAEEVAGKQRATAQRSLVQWIAGCAVILFTLAGALAFFAYKHGRDSGYAEGIARGTASSKQHEAEEGYKRGRAEGYREAASEKAAAAWANTAEGKLAAGLAKSGALALVAHCTGKGWEVRDGVCIPFADERRNVHGWRLPRPER